MYESFSDRISLRTGGHTWHNYFILISVDVAHLEIFDAKVGKGGTKHLAVRFPKNYQNFLAITAFQIFRQKWKI